MGLGRTWKDVSPTDAERIREYLLGRGGKEEKVRASYEKWRIRFSDSTFTYYGKGTLYSTPSNSGDSRVLEAWEYIDSVVGPIYVQPSKDFLVGLDETGKGEVIGDIVLVAVTFPKELFREVELITGTADTKNKHKPEYWFNIFSELEKLRDKGFHHAVGRISPALIEKGNLNEIMDRVYLRLLHVVLSDIDVSRCRIVVDDYGVKDTLKRFLNSLKKQGAEVIIARRSEERYLETKVASILSKKYREEEIRAINEDPKYCVDGLTIGSGNAGDPKTNSWLKAWWEKHRSWPGFVKRSFKSVRKIEEEMS